MKKLLIISIFIALVGCIHEQQNMNTGIIYGKNHAFSLTAPEGWILDNTSGVNKGLHAIFYRKGKTLANAKTVMYANTASLENPAHNTLEKLIDFDINNFKTHYSGLKIENGQDIQIKKNVVAKIKYLSGKSYGNFEAIAYIDAGKTGILIVMSSRTKDGFENSLAPFNDLVKSYFFMGNKVEVIH